jgi:acetyl-CoA C-acetyltransferase
MAELDPWNAVNYLAIGNIYKEQGNLVESTAMLNKILSFASHAQNPTWFSTAPVEAINKSLKKAGLTMNQIDLFDVNEAFAAVTMAAMKECKIPHEKVNVFGGAVAIGHPIGASGARILVTLMNAMKKKKAKYGCTAICIGGGEALSLIIERIR